MDSLMQVKQDFAIGFRDLIVLNPKLCIFENLSKYILNCGDLTIRLRLRSRQSKNLLEKNLWINHVKKYLRGESWMEVFYKDNKRQFLVIMLKKIIRSLTLQHQLLRRKKLFCYIHFLNRIFTMHHKLFDLID